MQPDNTASTLFATQNDVLFDESYVTIDINKIIWGKCSVIDNDNLSDVTLTASEDSGSLLLVKSFRTNHFCRAVSLASVLLVGTKENFIK